MAKNLKNLTVITKISTSKSLTSSLNYTNSDKPHNSDHGRIKHRDLASFGINCSDDPNLARLQMTKTLKEAHAHNVHDIREIKSFSDVLDYRNPHDRKLAIKLDLAMMKAEHPNCQIFCQLQVDGKTHHIHIHNHVCPRQFTDLKSITSHQMSIRYYIKPISDKIMKAHHFGTLKYHQSKSYQQRISKGEKYYSNHGGSWISVIRNHLNLARNYAVSSKDYVSKLKSLGINVEYLKMHTVNGKREIHFYKKPSNKLSKSESQMYLAKTGKHKGMYARPRKHFSYDFKYNGHKYKIRDKALGSDFFTKNLAIQFRINKANHRDVQFNDMLNNPNKIGKLIWSKKPVSYGSHQQSDGIQPHMIRGKKAVQADKDTTSIKHSPKSTSVVKTQKLMKYAHYAHMGTFTVHGYTKRATKTKSGTIIPLHYHEPVKARSFHFPVIHMPNKPVRPIFQMLGPKDTESVIAMNANLNIEKMDQYRQSYDDYMNAKDARSEAIDANQDMDAQTRQTNMDAVKDAREKHNMLIKEIKAKRGMSR